MKKTVKPNQNNPETKKIQVTKMFNGISSNYDILNKIITLGIDTIWRKRVVSLVKKNKHDSILDIATGTGDLVLALAKLKTSKIIGLDIVKKNLKLGKRVEIFHGSQSEHSTLDKIVKRYRRFDFIVDDGSHNYKDVKYSFEYLFQFLKDGGYYFIEDTQSSYIRELGGDGANLYNEKTVINYFKKIIP